MNSTARLQDTVQDDELRASYENERVSLLQRLRWIEKRLGIDGDTKRCPDCGKQHSRQRGSIQAA